MASPAGGAPTGPAAGPPDLAPIINIIRVNLIYYCCGFSVLIWDWLVLWPLEYKHIWRARPSLIKFLYIFARYWTLAVFSIDVWAYGTSWEHKYESCKKFNRFEPGLGLVGLLACDAIFALRVWSIWGQNIRVLALLGAGLAVEFAVMVVGTTNCEAAPLIPGALGCISGAKPGGRPWVIAFFAAPMVFQIFCLGLIAVKLYVDYGVTGTRPPILKLIVQHQLTYFACFALISTINVAFMSQTANLTIQPINAGITLIAAAVLSCRLILSLRNRDPEGLQPSISGRSLFESKATVSTGQSSKSGGESTMVGTASNLSRPTVHAQAIALDPFTKGLTKRPSGDAESFGDGSGWSKPAQ